MQCCPTRWPSRENGINHEKVNAVESRDMKGMPQSTEEPGHVHIVSVGKAKARGGYSWLFSHEQG